MRTAEPFDLTYDYLWGTDLRTRLILFATNFELLSGEGPANITAEVEDAAHRIYPLIVEYAAPMEELNSVNRIMVRLNDDLTNVGEVQVRIRYRGISSAPLLIGIGHKGGAP